MDLRSRNARDLAAAFLTADWNATDLERAAVSALGARVAPKWLRKLIAAVLEQTTTPYPPAPDRLARMICTAPAFRSSRAPAGRRVLLRDPVTAPAKFAPAAAFRGLPVPLLETPRALADWLGLSPPELEWFADVEGYRAAATQEASRHYRHAWIAKSGGRARLLEAPKPRLKAIQRRILREVLDPAPLHEAAHGFRRGRSCLTAAQRHAGEAVLVTVDLEDFFPSLPIGRVHGLFRSLGYPWSVARLLTGICSTVTPASVFGSLPTGRRSDDRTERLLRQRHLPQGAPTSPALANLCCWRLDCRLTALAARFEARYTRYGDDLAFSGDRDFARRVRSLLPLLATICADLGLTLNPRKSRIMHQGSRQQLTGLVVNRHINVPRASYDRLKAQLWNCLRHGAAGQNRDGHADFRAHLDGRITWVENVNPRKGYRLRLLFQQIDWS